MGGGYEVQLGMDGRCGDPTGGDYSPNNVCPAVDSIFDARAIMSSAGIHVPVIFGMYQIQAGDVHQLRSRSLFRLQWTCRDLCGSLYSSCPVRRP